MVQRTSLVHITLFIACGILLAVLIVLCVKRQITRFALKTRRVAHTPIGSGLPRHLKQELHRRLQRTAAVTSHPQLLCSATEAQWLADTREGKIHFLYRMKALDKTRELEQALSEADASVRRAPADDLRHFLLHQQEPGGLLRDVSKEALTRLAEVYLHARFDPMEFTEEHYQELERLVNRALHCIRHKGQPFLHRPSSLTSPDVSSEMNFRSSPLAGAAELLNRRETRASIDSRGRSSVRL